MYRQQKEMKAKRAQSGNDKIKEQMEQQVQYLKRGMTYGTEVTLSIDTFPSFIREKETKRNC